MTDWNVPHDRNGMADIGRRAADERLDHPDFALFLSSSSPAMNMPELAEGRNGTLEGSVPHVPAAI